MFLFPFFLTLPLIQAVCLVLIPYLLFCPVGITDVLIISIPKHVMKNICSSFKRKRAPLEIMPLVVFFFPLACP